MSKTQLPEDTTDMGLEESESSPDDETDLTRDAIFHVLQCRRRRLVLKYLQEYDGEGPARMSDIAEHIAALENDTTVDALRSQQRQRVYIALYQTHLTTMDDLGIIDYNQSRGFVEPTDLTARFDAYLDNEPALLTDDEDDENDENDGELDTEPVAEPDESTDTPRDVNARWHKRYLYAAGGSLLAAASVSSGIMSTPLLSGTGLVLIVSLIFVLLATSHWVTESSWPGAEWRDSSMRNQSQ